MTFQNNINQCAKNVIFGSVEVLSKYMKIPASLVSTATLPSELELESKDYMLGIKHALNPGTYSNALDSIKTLSNHLYKDLQNGELSFQTGTYINSLSSDLPTVLYNLAENYQVAGTAAVTSYACLLGVQGVSRLMRLGSKDDLETKTRKGICKLLKTDK